MLAAVDLCVWTSPCCVYMLHTKTMQTLRVAQPVQQLSFLHRMPMYKLPLHQTPARSGKQTDSTAAGTVNANWPARGYRRRVVASSSAGDAVYNSKPESGKSNYWDCTFALTKAIIGAGQQQRLRRDFRTRSGR